jgi:ATP-dependent helicase/nuclease subunit A
MTPAIRHKMILASAGSGKTYTLVNRYIRLLAFGVPAARINALTFTRKAAGEFLQNIFLRLREAAGDPREARRLSTEIEWEGAGCAEFRTILLRLVREMGDLQMGTIDSFFARLVGAFPYEVGLTRPHRIMDDFEQNASRMMALERLLATSSEEQDTRIRQLYKELTWGAEEKRVYSLFEDRLKKFHSLYLEVGNTDYWGNPKRIFPEAPWWAGSRKDLDRLLEEIALGIEELELKKSHRNAFEAILKAFTGWRPGMPFKPGKFFDDLLENREDLASGDLTIKVNRTHLDINQPMSGLLYELLRLYMGAEVGRRLMMTRSLGELIGEYDELYAQLVREAGSLVFSDLPMLLIKALHGETTVFTAEDMIYRLDGQTDHWLVDEFQDTSRIQWKVLSAFIDEVLQDPGGRRSFFYVGDVKQSIYRWRGGDSRLFNEIYERYSGGESGIEKDILSQSWRSAPAVLDCVNSLFGRAIRSELTGEFVADRWNALWREHVPSPRTRSLNGHAAWGLLDSETPLAEGCIELLREMDPLGKGLTCAILMRRNDDVAEMTQALRDAGIPASMEGQVEIAKDNIVGAWIRAFLTALARPDEAFPRAYLSCAGFAFAEADFRRLEETVREALTRDGYAEAVRLLIGFILKKVDPDPFLQRRGEQLLETATAFDGNGVQPLEQFIAYLAAARIDESTLQSQIQVMTVHKAKGLDFDVVLVGGFGGEPLVKPGQHGLHAERETTGEIDWVLDLPNKLALEPDPVLNAAASGEHNLDTFEALCLLYVAMTRARLGLYCISNTPARKSSALTWHALLESAFGRSDGDPEDQLIQWQRTWGQPDWFGEVQHANAAPARPISLERLAGPLPVVHPNLRRAASPSEEAHAEPLVVRRLRSNAGRRFGSIMHEFLATIDWIPFGNDQAVEEIIHSAPLSLQERIRQLFKSPHGREVFHQPDEPVDLWREKPYILRRQDTVANGIIDRAHVILDSAGKPLRVIIYDYKTDVLDPQRPAQEQLIERYGRQLERYCEAVCLLTDLAPEAVSASLIPV